MGWDVVISVARIPEVASTVCVKSRGTSVIRPESSGLENTDWADSGSHY